MNVFAHPDDDVVSTNILESYPDFVEVVDSTPGEMHTLPIKDVDGSDKILFSVKLDNGWYVSLITPLRDYYSDILYVLLILSILGEYGGTDLTVASARFYTRRRENFTPEGGRI